MINFDFAMKSCGADVMAYFSTVPVCVRFFSDAWVRPRTLFRVICSVDMDAIQAKTIGRQGRVGWVGGQADARAGREMWWLAGGATGWLCGAGGCSVAMNEYWNDLWNSTGWDGERIRRGRAGGMLGKLFLMTSRWLAGGATGWL